MSGTSGNKSEKMYQKFVGLKICFVKRTFVAEAKTWTGSGKFSRE